MILIACCSVRGEGEAQPCRGPERRGCGGREEVHGEMISELSAESPRHAAAVPLHPGTLGEFKL